MSMPNQLNTGARGGTGLFCIDNGLFCGDLNVKRAGVGEAHWEYPDAILEREVRFWCDLHRPLGIAM